MFVNVVIFLGLCLASKVNPGQAYRYTQNDSYTEGVRVRREAGGCVLPQYPDNGSYDVYNQSDAAPGQTFVFVALTVACNPGYRVVGSETTHCFSDNRWSSPMPECIRFCKLTPHPSVNYVCKVIGADKLMGTRMCREFEPSGTVVVPECHSPTYYSSSILLDMYCNDGSWDHVAICQPDCGTPTPRGTELIINGVSVARGELPWHAAIYDKLYRVNKQICGGSLISTRVVISAAHCFWKDSVGRRSANEYAVALGKIYRTWDSSMDSDVHKSDVRDIHIPVYFMGERGRFQDDIAVVILSTPVVYANHIRPVCIDFGSLFDRTQLQHANLGKVAGWGLTSEDGAETRVLQTTDLPYVEVAQCIKNLPLQFKQYVTNDKICAGGVNGTALCKGDSGGGLVFLGRDKGIDRYYLRGVASTAPTSASGHACNAHSYTTFTHILNHATFIKDYGLAVDSIKQGATTPQYTPPSPVPEPACPAVAPELTTAPSGSKAWDKCIEYQERFLYPCERGLARGNYCNHATGALAPGSTAVTRNESPHIALLGYDPPVDANAVGIVISERFILTPGHGTTHRPTYSIVATAKVGLLKSTESVPESHVYRIKRIIKHPQYKPPSRYNDLALLETETTIKFDQTVIPACLHTGEQVDDSRASSIGLIQDPESKSFLLHKETVMKSEEAECASRYAPARFLEHGYNATSQICYNENYCQGNSGISLQINNNRIHCMYTIIGVGSFWKGCFIGSQSMYTRVAGYTEWIESVVWP